VTDPDLMAKLRVVAGPSLNELQLEIIVDLVRSHDGRKGGRPPKPKVHQIDVSETGYENISETPVDGGFGGSFSGSGSLPDLSGPSKPNLRKRLNIMSVSPAFLAFWEIYPRKVCKKAALDAFRKIDANDVSINLMLDALRWQVEHDFSKRPLDKIPHASSWLNGRRWEDERQTSLPTNGHDPYKRLG
jgi:hypothetical protein